MAQDDGDLTPITRDEAVALGWRDAEDGTGTVTRAWDEWFFVDRDQRSWVRTTLQTVRRHLDEEWERIQRSPGDPGGPDPIDIFLARTGGLYAHEHEWLTLAATVRDAVSAYEIYLAKAFDEVLEHHRLQRLKPERTPPWGVLTAWYGLLGIEPRPGPVAEMVELRNILTHRRGELRSAGDRALFAEENGLWGDRLAHLDLDRVLRYMDSLGEATRSVDPVMWAYSWGGLRSPIFTRSHEGGHLGDDPSD